MPAARAASSREAPSSTSARASIRRAARASRHRAASRRSSTAPGSFRVIATVMAPPLIGHTADQPRQAPRGSERDDGSAIRAVGMTQPGPRVVAAVGEELQHQERVRRAALAQVDLDRPVPPAGALPDRQEVDPEPAQHALLTQRRGGPQPGLLDRQPVSLVGREPAAEEHLPGGAAQHLVVVETTSSPPSGSTRYWAEGERLSAPSTNASTTAPICSSLSRYACQVIPAASKASSGSRERTQAPSPPPVGAPSNRKTALPSPEKPSFSFTTARRRPGSRA